jgi:hypothetical protein
MYIISAIAFDYMYLSEFRKKISPPCPITHRHSPTGLAVTRLVPRITIISCIPNSKADEEVTSSQAREHQAGWDKLFCVSGAAHYLSCPRHWWRGRCRVAHGKDMHASHLCEWGFYPRIRQLDTVTRRGVRDNVNAEKETIWDDLQKWNILSTIVLFLESCTYGKHHLGWNGKCRRTGVTTRCDHSCEDRHRAWNILAAYTKTLRQSCRDSGIVLLRAQASSVSLFFHAQATLHLDSSPRFRWCLRRCGVYVRAGASNVIELHENCWSVCRLPEIFWGSSVKIQGLFQGNPSPIASLRGIP